MELERNSPLDALSGVGEKTKQLFQKLGIETISDLLGYFPRSYEQYGDPQKIVSLKEGDLVSVAASLSTPLSNRYVRNLCICSARCSDGSGEMQLTWYHMPYLKKSLAPGTVYIFRGRVKKRGALPVMEQPSIFQTDQYQKLTKSLQPVYSLTKGMRGRTIQKAVRQSLDELGPMPEYLPENIRKEYDLCSFEEALRGMHFPADKNELARARRRLVFDEFFFFLLQLRNQKEQRMFAESHFQITSFQMTESVIASLPYELTHAQKRVWEKIREELSGQKPMARLIQGDVGSGKTILAVLALFAVAENGFQGALMAPTELLARQHYELICTLIAENDLPFRADLLTGSMSAKQKSEVYERMESAETDLVIGTHALIQEKAQFQNLALVITDEQHRFGVRQRERLSEKGSMPHTIVMSATPIPRTIAVILYGDLDLSVIDELPAKRLPVKSCVVGPAYRRASCRLIEEQVKSGHQAYVICPMAEESDLVDAENVIEYADTLRGILPKECCVAFLHGRMKAEKKEEIMSRFLKNEIQVLVSTTVVEVGVDVPNATVMLIENAERFGLAQLHQLRGRVGRGEAQSYCIFLCTLESPQIRERLEILTHSTDGFEIANRDMQMRGPGDLFGERQSGTMNFKLADIYADAAILQQADEAVGELFREDPDLTKPCHAALRTACEQSLHGQGDHWNL